MRKVQHGVREGALLCVQDKGAVAAVERTGDANGANVTVHLDVLVRLREARRHASREQALLAHDGGSSAGDSGDHAVHGWVQIAKKMEEGGKVKTMSPSSNSDACSDDSCPFAFPRTCGQLFNADPRRRPSHARPTYLQGQNLLCVRQRCHTFD